jgi:hypothetical protein
MSVIQIVKGLPISTLIRLKNDTTTVNLNDGTWTVSAALHYQTKNGPEPFPLTLTPSGSTLTFALDASQTTQLNHLGTGYLLAIKVTALDDSVFIENFVQVSVVDGL